MISLQSIWELFLPVIKFFLGIWDFLNTGVYDAWSNLITRIPILGELYKPIVEIISKYTGFDEFLNQFTVFTITFVGGLSLIIILTIVGFFTDKVGL